MLQLEGRLEVCLGTRSCMCPACNSDPMEAGVRVRMDFYLGNGTRKLIRFAFWKATCDSSMGIGQVLQLASIS